MASTAPSPSLASWRLESAVEPFFSGGAVAALPDGRALTACGDEVKVRIKLVVVHFGEKCVDVELANCSPLFFPHKKTHFIHFRSSTSTRGPSSARSQG